MRVSRRTGDGSAVPSGWRSAEPPSLRIGAGPRTLAEKRRLGLPRSELCCRMEKRPTAQDLLALLREHGVELQERLTRYTPHVQLSLPTDGRGARLKVSVEPGNESRIPAILEVLFAGRKLEVPLEAVPDFQDYVLHT